MATTIFTHILHFRNGEEMSYAHSHLENFVAVILVYEEEFDGDAPFEVVFTTSKRISQANIKKMKEHFDPKDSKFNVVEE